MKLLTSASLASFVALMWSGTGCSPSVPFGGALGDNTAYAPYSSFTNFTQEPIELVRGHLTGDIGPMRGFDTAAQLNGYHEEAFTSVEVIVTAPRGAAMALLDIHGGINHPDLQPGTSWVFRRNDPPTAGSELFITGLGCAGDGPVGDWDFDRPLDEVRVQVEATENPDVRRLNFTTVSRDDEAHGYIDVSNATN